MERKRIAIACQGGGSQCAFVAGALKGLFARGVDEQFQIVGLSGTSGGGLTAAVAWMGLLAKAHGDRTPIGDRVVALWKDLSAQTPLEVAIDRTAVQTLRLTEQGTLPSLAKSPASPVFRLLSALTARIVGRPEFTDLRALILKHLDFSALPALVEPDSPTLMVGASNVLQGTFKTFSSAKNEITVDSLLASAAIPNLFPAVWVDGQPYWDGIFSSNPPIADLLRRGSMGASPLPKEIWIIQVNRAQHDTVPEKPCDIYDRRNHLAGNLSLQHELQLIDVVNMILREGLLTESIRSRFGFDMTEPIAVRFIRMSKGLAQGLDYPSKLSRQPDHINRMLADGEAQADAFLADLPSAERVPDARPLEVVVRDEVSAGMH